MLHFHRTTIDDLGILGTLSIDVEIKCDIYKAEPQTWDYPGWPAVAELESVTALRIHSDRIDVDLTQRADWQPDFSKIAHDLIENSWEEYSEEILEHIAGIEEYAREADYEARAERQ